jgi:hypothetical protein
MAMMIKTIIVLAAIMSTGCNELSQSAMPANLSHAETVNCQDSKQCGEDFICVKEQNSTLGTCIEILEQ